MADLCPCRGAHKVWCLESMSVLLGIVKRTRRRLENKNRI